MPATEYGTHIRRGVLLLSCFFFVCQCIGQNILLLCFPDWQPQARIFDQNSENSRHSNVIYGLLIMTVAFSFDLVLQN